MTFNDMIGTPDLSPETDNAYRDAGGYYHVCYMAEDGAFYFYRCYGESNAKAIAEAMSNHDPMCGVARVMTREDWELLLATIPQSSMKAFENAYPIWAASTERAAIFGRAARYIPAIADQFAACLFKHYAATVEQEETNAAYDAWLAYTGEAWA